VNRVFLRFVQTYKTFLPDKFRKQERESGLVKIPNTVNKIPAKTFINCRELKRLFMPNFVKNIQSFAFSGCKNLTNINLSKQLKDIGLYAFAESGLITITIPGKVQTMDKYAF